MLKMEMENEMVERKIFLNDLVMAIEELAEFYDDKTANGYIMDMETGEVLVTLACGDITYVSHDTMMYMVQTLMQVEPEAMCLLGLLGFFGK